MKLSELKTGETGVILKVSGHGGFRKRIIEMGFIKGKTVEVLLNAPLHDPVKYKIMGYEVSLRHSEADQIEVLPDTVDPAQVEDVEYEESEQSAGSTSYDSTDKELTPEKLSDAVRQKSRTINVALVGNPNCGKTSLFNFASGAHERVGNYSGVTVDAKVGHASFDGYEFNLVDLPGTYSLSAYSPEELYVRKQLVDKTPDVVINVIDASNLERNLYLTTQLIDMHIRMVCALNMYDETEQRGDHIDAQKLSELFGIPMIPTVFTNGRGVQELFRQIIAVYEGTEDESLKFRHIHINHGHEIEHGIEEMQEHLKKYPELYRRYSTRYLAIKLLEHDKDVEQLISPLGDSVEIFKHRDTAAARVKEETGNDSETAIMDAKYGFINGALKEANYSTGDKKDTYQTTHVIDHVLTNKYFGFPIFFLVLLVMFTATFVIGQYPMDWIEAGVDWLGQFISTNMPDGPVKDMVVDGITLENMTDEELARDLEKISVYARVAPEHKIRIVNAWQAKGKIVGMSGDGVNDAPALKQADIGIAMGITGSEVSKDAADMILTDDNFATIVKAVTVGRNIFTNIKNAIKYLLTGNTGAIFVVIATTLLAFFDTKYVVPFAAIQLLFINLVTDSLPAIAIGTEPGTDEVLKQAPRDPKEPILTRSTFTAILIEAGLIAIAVFIGYYIGINTGEGYATTFAFLVLCLARLFNGFSCRSDLPLTKIGLFTNKNTIIAFLIGIALVSIIIFIPAIGSIFKVMPLSGVQILTIVGLALAPTILVQIIKIIRNR